MTDCVLSFRYDKMSLILSKLKGIDSFTVVDGKHNIIFAPNDTLKIPVSLVIDAAGGIDSIEVYFATRNSPVYLHLVSWEIVPSMYQILFNTPKLQRAPAFLSRNSMIASKPTQIVSKNFRFFVKRMATNYLLVLRPDSHACILPL